MYYLLIGLLIAIIVCYFYFKYRPLLEIELTDTGWLILSIYYNVKHNGIIERKWKLLFEYHLYPEDYR